jgi:hypothetical protein
MSESALNKLKREARERDFKRKAEVIRREHVEREKVEHVQLTRTIYVEPLALHEPIKEEVKIF